MGSGADRIGKEMHGRMQHDRKKMEEMQTAIEKCSTNLFPEAMFAEKRQTRFDYTLALPEPSELITGLKG